MNFIGVILSLLLFLIGIGIIATSVTIENRKILLESSIQERKNLTGLSIESIFSSLLTMFHVTLPEITWYYAIVLVVIIAAILIYKLKTFKSCDKKLVDKVCLSLIENPGNDLPDTPLFKNLVELCTETNKKRGPKEFIKAL